MVLTLAVASLLLLASAASADPPANDKFEDAQVLGPGLPILVPGSNVEATKESSGEPYEVFAAGNSVWFSWTAPSDEVVSIDTCNSEFATLLTVFSGSGLGALTEVGYDSNIDGRYCPDAAGVTFRAVSGTTYSILVDGDAFSFPEGPPPITQGSFELRIAAVPLPSNDDFDQAAPMGPSVTAVINEEFSYSTWSGGFNWNATKEAGEPDHAGDPGGASVWYYWTAPRSGHTEIGACGSFNILLGLYTGDAVNTLTPVPLESRPVPCFVNFQATAGTTYRIALDGRLDTDTGLPFMTGLGIHVSMNIPPPAKKGASAQAGPPLDTVPPRTAVSKRVLKKRPSTWILSFTSNEPGSTFRCKLDEGAFHKCRPLRRVDPAAKGRHVLRVVAVDKAGNVDPTPALVRFGIAGKPHVRR